MRPATVGAFPAFGGDAWLPSRAPHGAATGPPGSSDPYWDSVSPGRRTWPAGTATPPRAPAPGSPVAAGDGGPARRIPLIGVLWAVVGFLVGEVLGGIFAEAVAVASGSSISSAGPTFAGEVGLWVGLLGAVVFVSRRYGTGRLAGDFTLGFRPVDLLYGAAAAAAGLVVAAVVEVPFAGTRFAGSNTGILRGAKGSSVGYAVITVIVAVGAPLVEELFFRGLIRTALASRLGQHGAIWGQALLFGLAHIGGAHGWGNVSVVVAIGSLGVILGYAAYLTRRLGAGMVAHSLFNLTAAVAILVR